MRGFIPAAGFGTRLRPLTSHIPKALVPFAGKPLLTHALSFLESAGISSIGINAHYLPEQISRFIDHQKKPCTLFIETPEILGTGGALQFARTFLSAEPSFVVANADIVTRFDLKSCMESFEVSDDLCRLLAFPPAAGGSIRYDPDSLAYAGTVHDPPVSGLLTADFIGVALYRREFLSLLTDEDFSIVPVWHRALQKGYRVSVAMIRDGFWRDLGTPAALAQAHFDLIDGVLPPFTDSCARIDRERKCLFPTGWSLAQKECCHCYCWIDQYDFQPEKGSSRIVALPESKRYSDNNNSELIYTPWEEIPFYE